jgi:hypothetical protein
MRMIVSWIALSAALAAAPEPDVDPKVRAVLTRDLKFGPVELTELERGRVMRHSIPSTVGGEIAVAGAVRVNAPKRRLLDGVRDIVRFKQDPDVLQIGRFSNPPKLQDMDGLTVDKDDFDAATCRVKNCGTRLPARVIERAQEIGSDGAGSQDRAATLFKQALLDHVTAYVSGGSGLIEQFDNDTVPIRPGDEFAGVLTNTPAIGALAPELPAHLARFAARHGQGVEDFLYWSKERFGMAPFITVTHVAIVCPSERTCLTVTRDVYSSRYIDASLSLTIATDSAASPNVFYLVYANRSRASALKGRLSGLRRAFAERRVRSSVDENLTALKNRLERGL